MYVMTVAGWCSQYLPRGGTKTHSLNNYMSTGSQNTLLVQVTNILAVTFICFKIMKVVKTKIIISNNKIFFRPSIKF